MVNYQNGKIYIIRSHQTDNVYIGATIEKLSGRMSKHRHRYKKWLEGNKKYYSSYEILKYDDAYIELLEKYPCNSVDELCKKEGEYIRNNACVNKRIEGRTQKEYNEDNKEHLREKNKEFREEHKEDKKKYDKEYYEKKKERIQQRNIEYCKKNKEHIQQKQKEKYERTKEEIREKGKIKITCVCGSITSIRGKARHEKTKKHIEFLT